MWYSTCTSTLFSSLKVCHVGRWELHYNYTMRHALSWEYIWAAKAILTTITRNGLYNKEYYALFKHTDGILAI